MKVCFTLILFPIKSDISDFSSGNDILSQHHFHVVVCSSLSSHQEPELAQISSGNVGRLFAFVILLVRLDSAKLLNMTGNGSDVPRWTSKPPDLRCVNADEWQQTGEGTEKDN